MIIATTAISLFSNLKALVFGKGHRAKLSVVQKIQEDPTKAPEFFVRATAGNGEIIFHTECYTRQADAYRAAETISKTKFIVYRPLP